MIQSSRTGVPPVHHIWRWERDPQGGTTYTHKWSSPAEQEFHQSITFAPGRETHKGELHIPTNDPVQPNRSSTSPSHLPLGERPTRGNYIYPQMIQSSRTGVPPVHHIWPWERDPQGGTTYTHKWSSPAEQEFHQSITFAPGRETHKGELHIPTNDPVQPNRSSTSPSHLPLGERPTRGNYIYPQMIQSSRTGVPPVHHICPWERDPKEGTTYTHKWSSPAELEFHQSITFAPGRGTHKWELRTGAKSPLKLQTFDWNKLPLLRTLAIRELRTAQDLIHSDCNVKRKKIQGGRYFFTGYDWDSDFTS